MIIGDSDSAKTKILLNLIKNPQPDIDKVYLYFKDPFESKYQLLINLEDYNPTKKRKVLTVLDDIIADMESNKKLVL